MKDELWVKRNGEDPPICAFGKALVGYGRVLYTVAPDPCCGAFPIGLLLLPYPCLCNRADVTPPANPPAGPAIRAPSGPVILESNLELFRKLSVG